MLLDPQPHWPGLCKMLGLETLTNDARFADHEARTRNAAELVAILEARIETHDWAYWRPIFEAWDAPWELIRTIEEISEDPQVLANDMIFHVAAEGRRLRLVSGPSTFDGQAKPVEFRPAPAMGKPLTNCSVKQAIPQARSPN